MGEVINHPCMDKRIMYAEIKNDIYGAFLDRNVATQEVFSLLISVLIDVADVMEGMELDRKEFHNHVVNHIKSLRK